jgi:hypothetical protein
VDTPISAPLLKSNSANRTPRISRFSKGISIGDGVFKET